MIKFQTSMQFKKRARRNLVHNTTATNVNKASAANSVSGYAINVENRKQLQWLPISN